MLSVIVFPLILPTVSVEISSSIVYGTAGASVNGEIVSVVLIVVIVP